MRSIRPRPVDINRPIPLCRSLNDLQLLGINDVAECSSFFDAPKPHGEKTGEGGDGGNSANRLIAVPCTEIKTIADPELEAWNKNFIRPNYYIRFATTRDYITKYHVKLNGVSHWIAYDAELSDMDFINSQVCAHCTALEGEKEKRGEDRERDKERERKGEERDRKGEMRDKKGEENEGEEGREEERCEKISLDYLTIFIDALETANGRISEVQIDFSQCLAIVRPFSSHLDENKIRQIFDFWILKRKKNGKSLVRSLWPVSTANDTNPMVVFRSRVANKRQTRNSKKSVQDIANALTETYSDINKIIKFSKLIRKREEMKAVLDKLNEFLFLKAVSSSYGVETLEMNLPVVGSSANQIATNANVNISASNANVPICSRLLEWIHEKFLHQNNKKVIGSWEVWKQRSRRERREGSLLETGQDDYLSKETANHSQIRSHSGHQNKNTSKNITGQNKADNLLYDRYHMMMNKTYKVRIRYGRLGRLWVDRIGNIPSHPCLRGFFYDSSTSPISPISPPLSSPPVGGASPSSTRKREREENLMEGSIKNVKTKKLMAGGNVSTLYPSPYNVRSLLDANGKIVRSEDSRSEQSRMHENLIPSNSSSQQLIKNFKHMDDIQSLFTFADLSFLSNDEKFYKAYVDSLHKKFDATLKK